MTSSLEDLIQRAEEPELGANFADIEATLLAGVFSDSPDIVARILAEAKPKDFFFDKNRRLAFYVWPEASMGRHVDAVILRHRIEADPNVDDKDKTVGEMLEVLDDIVAREKPTKGKVEAYLGIFVDVSRRRLAQALIHRAGDELAQMETTPEGAASQVFKAIADLDVARRFGALQSEGEDLEAFFAALEARQDPGQDFTGLNTGFTHLNRIINGLMAGRLVVIGAAPGTGKTTFLKQVADHVVENHKSAVVLFVSLEQSAEELRIKSLSRLSGVENRYIERGKLDVTKEGWKRVKEAKEEFAKFADRLFVLEGDRATTVDRIRMATMQIRQATELDDVVVIVDYLQILPTDTEYRDTRTKVDFVTSELRRIARDLDVAVVAISSISRDAYKQGGGQLSDFKESGGIEYGADVGAIMIEDKDDSHGDRKGKDLYLGVNCDYKRIFLDVVKNRAGEKGRVKLNFIPSRSVFVEVGQDQLPD